MKEENVYIGDILICSKYPDRYSRKLEEAKIDIIKENAILIKIENKYVDLDSINNELDLLKSNKNSLKTYYTYEGDKFVGNLRNYYFSNKEKVTIKSLKKKRK